jgi:hypothetical protein
MHRGVQTPSTAHCTDAAKKYGLGSCLRLIPRLGACTQVISAHPTALSTLIAFLRNLICLQTRRIRCFWSQTGHFARHRPVPSTHDRPLGDLTLSIFWPGTKRHSAMTAAGIRRGVPRQLFASGYEIFLSYVGHPAQGASQMHANRITQTRLYIVRNTYDALLVLQVVYDRVNLYLCARQSPPLRPGQSPGRLSSGHGGPASESACQ